MIIIFLIMCQNILLPLDIRGCSSTIMISLLPLLVSALDLGAIFFTVRMMQRCFRDKKKQRFIKKCKILGSFQCVCQVTILFSDVTESWNGFSVQGKDSCNVFRVLSLSMTFFQTGNLTAILTVYHEHSVGYENRDLNSNLRMFAVLILGFAGSLMIWWHNCFAKAAVSQAVLEVALFLTMLLIFLLLVVALVKNNDEDNLKTTSPESDMATHSCSLLWKLLRVNKKPLFFIVLIFSCLGALIRRLPCSIPLLCQDFDRGILLDAVLYSLITKFVVGIVLPIILHDLINSSDLDREIKG